MARKGPPIDWERIEAEFRANQLSVAEIARQHGISHTYINRKAKEHNWQRDLTARVQERVSAKLVSEGVSENTLNETIEVAAETRIQIVRGHMASAKRAFGIVGALMADLEETIAHRAEIEDAIIDDTKGGEDEGKAQYKRRAMMLRAVALPSNSATLLQLSAAVKNFVAIERQAFSIDASPSASDDTHGPDIPPRSNTYEEWYARREKPVPSVGAAAGAAV